jgi:hypothetical protein
VSVPGPPGGLWALSLVLWAATAGVVGEAVRGTAVRWVPLWRSPEPIERFVLDFYLGGAALYAVAAVEVGAFVRPVVLGVPIAAALVLLHRVYRRRRQAQCRTEVEESFRGLGDGWTLLAVASAAGLFAVELGEAVRAPTGNTFDSSLLTTYVALLFQHGSVPLSFRPYGAPAILYPQGTTVWLGWAQLVFGLPPARTAVLVTPWFQALAPLAGFVLGKRLFGTSRAGAAFALGLAWLGPSTRALVGGSNDFVVALPLVLLLASQTWAWTDRRPPDLGTTVGFGLLLGYSAALNVVGTEWLLPALIVLGALATPRFGASAAVWWGRWSAACAGALVAGIPSWYVLLAARASPASLVGALTSARGAPVGITAAQFVGDVDPFLFRGTDVELSPLPLVRLELALLLVLGVGVLLWLASRPEGLGRRAPFARWATGAGVATGAWLALEWGSGLPGSPLRDLAYISSGAEFSWSLFTVFALVASVPLAEAFEQARPPPGALRPAARVRTRGAADGRLRALAPVLFAVIVLAPAVALTPTSLGPVLATTYSDFGNVSGSDFAMFAYAAAHFAPGARVLVAPGSAAEFLPGYARGITLLYPMAPGWRTVNASYALVLRELTNGTLDAAGLGALASLTLDRIVVTGNNTVLWPALWAAPLLRAEVGSTPTFPVDFHDGDAWVFDATACRTGTAGCP